MSIIFEGKTIGAESANAIADCLQGYYEGFGPLADIVKSLEDISEKLDRNHATLQELLRETRNSNLALLNYGEDSQKKVILALSEVDQTSLFNGSVLYIGYRRSELTDFLEYATRNRGLAFKYSKGISSASDLAAVLTSCNDGDVVLLNLEEISNAACLPMVLDAIEDCALEIKVGRGIDAKSIRLDLPPIIFHFYATTDLFIPKELDNILDAIYSCKE